MNIYFNQVTVDLFFFALVFVGCHELGHILIAMKKGILMGVGVMAGNPAVDIYEPEFYTMFGGMVFSYLSYPCYYLWSVRHGLGVFFNPLTTFTVMAVGVSCFDIFAYFYYSIKGYEYEKPKMGLCEWWFYISLDKSYIPSK